MTLEAGQIAPYPPGAFRIKGVISTFWQLLRKSPLPVIVITIANIAILSAVNYTIQPLLTVISTGQRGALIFAANIFLFGIAYIATQNITILLLNRKITKEGPSIRYIIRKSVKSIPLVTAAALPFILSDILTTYQNAFTGYGALMTMALVAAVISIIVYLPNSPCALIEGRNVGEIYKLGSFLTKGNRVRLFVLLVLFAIISFCAGFTCNFIPAFLISFAHTGLHTTIWNDGALSWGGRIIGTLLPRTLQSVFILSCYLELSKSKEIFPSHVIATVFD